MLAVEELGLRLVVEPVTGRQVVRNRFESKMEGSMYCSLAECMKAVVVMVA